MNCGNEIQHENKSTSSKDGVPSTSDPSLVTRSAYCVQVEGLADTLSSVRHELGLVGHSSKYDWVNKRLITLRNAILAFSVVVGVIIAMATCYHEAYRQTLNISAFDVPEYLAERGITGQVVAKALFDELIKRRKTVTTLDAGDLKEVWTKHQIDVAIPETGVSIESMFRYLRHLTGNEIVVDGEMLVNGDNITIKARVFGNPPTVASGKLDNWEWLLGQLADYVYETTQPAVLASYLGLTAKTSDDIVALSRYVVRMTDLNPRPASNAMAVAYDAYGSALMHEDKLVEALEAFNRALTYDSQYGLAVINAAEVNFRLDNRKEASTLYDRAAHMKISYATKRQALRRRVSAALNNGDCVAGETAIRHAKAFSRYDDLWERWMDARYLVECAYEEEEGVKIARRIVRLHPDSANSWLYLSVVV